jgi:hypothetical protein
VKKAVAAIPARSRTPPNLFMTGEDFLASSRPQNPFMGRVMALTQPTFGIDGDVIHITNCYGLGADTHAFHVHLFAHQDLQCHSTSVMMRVRAVEAAV